METIHHAAGHDRSGLSPRATTDSSGLPAVVLERPRYFPRQLITPDELTLEADYFRDRLRRHNRYLHGWGVVCGALVCVVPARSSTHTPDPRRPDSGDGADGRATEPWVVCVEPGFVLGPFGDEIVIDRAHEVSIRGSAVAGCGHDHADLTGDPWCREVFVDRRVNPVYVAVRYHECQVRPVRAQPGGCGCDETNCEYSRFRDGYVIGILDHCPDSHRRAAAKEPFGFVHRNPECSDGVDDPWTVLAEVTFDEDGTITRIDNCACRRIVPTTRDWLLTCADDGSATGVGTYEAGGTFAAPAPAAPEAAAAESAAKPDAKPTPKPAAKPARSTPRRPRNG